MTGWVEHALREAVDLAEATGHRELASDLSRICTALDFDEIDVMRSVEAEHLADEILEAEDLPDLAGLLKRLSSLMGASHCTLQVIDEVPSASFTARVLTSYPEEWISRYLDRRYYFVDPVAQACQSQVSGFFWEDLDASSLVVRSFWADAAKFGVGPSGYTIVVTTERGDRLAFSLSSSADRNSFRAAVTRNEGDISTLAFFLSEAFCRLASEERPLSFSPSDDQMIVLRKIANGVAESALKDHSFQYGSYSTIERSICSLFRTKTVAQAAVLAARMGLLDHAPPTKDEFVSVSAEVVTNAVIVPLSLRSVPRESGSSKFLVQWEPAPIAGANHTAG